MVTTAICCLLGAGSCGIFEGDCTSELRIHQEPQSAELRVGQSFQAAVALSGCGGSQRVSDRITWSSSDPGVLGINPATGRAVALRTGTAEVLGSGQTYGRVATIPVTVH